MNFIYKEIKNDFQIKKFGYYGLLKNLQFFEPYLYVYLLSLNINLFYIGILISVREAITYIFEIPSGIFADNYGKKTELVICFVFYIVSFILFFASTNFYILLTAMIFYGFGDAFRSGTHKAMIYSYLEQKNWFSKKTFVYGRTRSFSLIGSSVSAFTSIIMVIYFKDLSWIFLFSVIPYMLNFILILSYPNSLNERTETSISFRRFFQLSIYQLKSIVKKPELLNVLVSSSLFDAIFKTIKDYIQPILIIAITGLGIKFLNFDNGVNKKVILGFVYGLFYIFSSISSRNVYRLNKLAKSETLMHLFFDVMAIILVLIYLFLKVELVFPILILFFLLYILKNARRPLVVDVTGNIMEKKERATVLSIDSQLKSLFVIILAPAFGFIATKFSIQTSFIALAILIFVSNIFLKRKRR